MKSFALLAAIVSAAALAQTAPPQGGETRRGPPPEALKACESKKSGDACGFTAPPGKMEGTCWSPDTSKPLACKPKDGPPKK